MVNEVFYDIEAFVNLFTCSMFCPQTNTVDVYFICDNLALLDASGNYIDEDNARRQILAVNHTWLQADATIRFHNLRHPQKAAEFVSSFVKINIPNRLPFLNDTDAGYDKEHTTLLFGYNSTNYDLVMLSYYFAQSWTVSNGVSMFTDVLSANMMHQFNNILFQQYRDHMPDALGDNDSVYKKVYWSMLNSGRHIDVAALNEKQSKVALKRLLGLLGYQIKESEILGSGNKTPIVSIDMFNEAVAYNVSDICGTERLFREDVYQSTFELKQGLLESYPELVYDRAKDKYHHPIGYKPAVGPHTVRKGRLRIDSTSANFATKCICPYGNLDDYESVSFMYPDSAVAKELGIKPFNVLDELMTWYESVFHEFPEIVNQFRCNIYDYYKGIEGKNFNSGAQYRKKYGIVPAYDVKTMLPVGSQVVAQKVFNGCVEYYKEDGSTSGCYAQFSIGGIHGAEYNLALYQQDLAKAEEERQLLEAVRLLYPEPHTLRTAKEVTIDDVIYPYTRFLKPGAKVSDPASCAYKTVKMPQLFVLKKNKYVLNDRYTYTSSALCDHEDFSSYYPSLLINMNAMYNPGLGYDRYHEIYDLKEEYGRMMKDDQFTKVQQAHFQTKRGGTKLVLNSLSGAGDLGYDTPVRMNNKIISMRLIGQFFTFRIAQEQTLAGARVISTNTDGLYAVSPDKEKTRRILADLETLIHVKIEPEEMYLVSKDTNNRVEFSADRTEILNASGGTVACYKAPTPTAALSHPAIVDNAFVTWIQRMGSNMSLAPTEQQMLCFLQSFINYNLSHDNLEHVLIMFQNIVASSPSSRTYTTMVHGADVGEDTCETLQHYNRVFYVRPDVSDDHLINVTVGKRTANSVENPVAIKLLNDVGVTEFTKDEYATFGKISDIDQTDCVRIYNKPIVGGNKEELQELLSQLDLSTYARLIVRKYVNSWFNIPAA